MRTRLRTTILPLVATAVLAACGGGDDGATPEVASLGTVAAGDTGDSGDGTGSTGEPDGEELTPEEREAAVQDAAVRYTRCMREHGVDMPDPGADGGILMAVDEGDDMEAIEEAQEACQPIMEEIAGSFEPPSPEEQAKMREQMLEFTACMREHGVDMPDPVFDDDGRVTVSVGGSLDDPGAGGVAPDDAAFQEASEACGTGEGGFMVSAAPVASAPGD